MRVTDHNSKRHPKAIPPTVVAGVGPDAPLAVNALGGKQSASPYRMDLLPALATLGVAGVLKHGADKYGVDNWRSLSVEEHLNHALVHAYSYLAGDRSDDHMGHFHCRAAMAHEVHLVGGAVAREDSQP